MVTDTNSFQLRQIELLYRKKPWNLE